ncbi:hypothetical protein MAF45_10575 [Mesosutterella sp. OilRF-GAM-744-9]|uniref:Uncharacterized protein n=1 Tax=Mesosutterella porci TaxID=2915351 RepID=A0ABS9MU57_9BURK|nr:hypothetical protein [Mesosutterella sp. oilRF-744-WT-GAM-9]MCG5031879.1 hypothetical protein [Mesosutterella sp. oilRF-744-WT-GAM-9]
MGTDMSYWSSQLAALDHECERARRDKAKRAEVNKRSLERVYRTRKSRIPTPEELAVIVRAYGTMPVERFCLASGTNRCSMSRLIRGLPVGIKTLEKALTFSKTIVEANGG